MDCPLHTAIYNSDFLKLWSESKESIYEQAICVTVNICTCQCSAMSYTGYSSMSVLLYRKYINILVKWYTSKWTWKIQRSPHYTSDQIRPISDINKNKAASGFEFWLKFVIANWFFYNQSFISSQETCHIWLNSIWTFSFQINFQLLR